MENYLLVALVVLAIWLVGIFLYLVVSSRQLDIEEEIEEINELLDKNSHS